MWRAQIITQIVKSRVRETRLTTGNVIEEICSRRNISCNSALLQDRQDTTTVKTKDEKHRQFQKFKAIGPMGWFLLLVPITTFGLGTWQVKRRKWKLSLIADLKARMTREPQELPYDLSELDKMEYYPVRVRGHFDHSRELYLGPRSLIVDGDSASQGGLISRSPGGQHGYCVVVPFHLADRDLTILVNRGWVPTRCKSPTTREQGQIEGEVELVGLVRCAEQRAPFTPRNQKDVWFYRDLPKMAEVSGAAPVFLDAAASSTVKGGPIGGQTLVSLRNEHMSYILTWYGLSLVTSFLWYRHFIHGYPAL